MNNKYDLRKVADLIDQVRHRREESLRRGSEEVEDLRGVLRNSGDEKLA